MPLTTSGGLATLTGRLEVQGAGVQLETANLDLLTSCDGKVFAVEAGAAFSSADFDANLAGVGPCPPFAPEPGAIFSDDFESGNTSAWSTTPP